MLELCRRFRERAVAMQAQDQIDVEYRKWFSARKGFPQRSSHARFETRRKKNAELQDKINVETRAGFSSRNSDTGQGVPPRQHCRLTRTRSDEGHRKNVQPPSARRKCNSTAQTHVGNEMQSKNSTGLLHKRNAVCDSGTCFLPEIRSTRKVKNVQETLLEFPLPTKQHKNRNLHGQSPVPTVLSDSGLTYMYLSDIMEPQRWRVLPSCPVKDFCRGMASPACSSSGTDSGNSV